MRRLAEQGNAATLALLDLRASDVVGPVGVKEVALAAGITETPVHGQLAGLTMRLKNLHCGFEQNLW